MDCSCGHAALCLMCSTTSKVATWNREIAQSLALQRGRSEFFTRTPLKNAGHGSMRSSAWHWQRQADPWSSLDRQPSLMGESQASLRSCLNKTKGMTVAVVLWRTHMCKQIDTQMEVILHFSYVLFQTGLPCVGSLVLKSPHSPGRPPTPSPLP